MAASLVGLGRDGVDQDLAAARLRLVYGVIFGLDGWPLVYMGDEIALGNDETFLADSLRREEGRWLHRPEMDWDRAASGVAGDDCEGVTFNALKGYSAAARGLDALGISGAAIPVEIPDRAILAFERRDGPRRLLVLANLSPREIETPLPAIWEEGGFDLLSENDIAVASITLASYGLAWLTSRS